MSELSHDQAALGAQAVDEPTIGDWLRRAREARGQSIGEVAQALKLTGRQVEAMEMDRFELLPGPAFVRGFLRNYARYIGVDPVALLAEFEQIVTPPAVELEPVSNAQGVMPTGGRSRTAHFPVAAIAGGFLVAVLAGWYFDWFQLPGSDVGGPEVVVQEDGVPGTVLSPQPEILDNEPVAAPISGVEGGATLPADVASPASGGAAVEQPQTADSVPAAAGPAPVAALAPSPVTEAPVVPAGVEHLRFSFEGESWIEVRDGAGKIVYSGVSGAGSTRTVQGEPPFALVIGNARQVSLEYKGEKVDLTPHVRVSVARFALQ